MFKRIRVKGDKFFDADGKEFVPCGVNMVCKDKSKGYIGEYTDEDFKFLRSLGMNIVRLGIFWDAVEPKPGKYDLSYIEKIDEIVALAAKNDICVFLDMHQDLFSAEFEDGAPGWATITDGHVYEKTELWSDAYLFSDAVQTAFENFWNNREVEDRKGLLDYYEQMWKFLANHFSKNDYVVGYDVLNEPFPGLITKDIVSNLFGVIVDLLPPEYLKNVKSEKQIQELVFGLFADSSKKAELFAKIGSEENLLKIVHAIEPITSYFEEARMNPFYEQITRAIKKEDKYALIMLENNYFSNAGIPSHVNLCKDKNGNIFPGQVYAPHGYDIFVDTDMYESNDTTRIDLIFAAHKAVAERLGVPMLVGEWGCYPAGSDGQLVELKYLLNKYKQMNAGNTYYEYAHLKNEKLAKALASR